MGSKKVKNLAEAIRNSNLSKQEWLELQNWMSQHQVKLGSTQSAFNKSVAPLSNSTKAQKPKAPQQKLQPLRKSRVSFDRCIVTEEDYMHMTGLGHLIGWHGYLSED